jgi:hypothetical protein
MRRDDLACQAVVLAKAGVVPNIGDETSPSLRALSTTYRSHLCHPEAAETLRDLTDTARVTQVILA